jgi:hypothetical protein
MFCSKCGFQANQSLNYCNNCGARMLKETEEGKILPLNALITALALVALGGLGMLVGLISMLLFNGMTHEAIAIISICYLATLFAICFSMTRLISKLIESPTVKKTEKSESSQTPQLSMPTNPQLKEYQQPIGSVTDQTTRTFDEAFVKRN